MRFELVSFKVQVFQFLQALGAKWTERVGLYLQRMPIESFEVGSIR